MNPELFTLSQLQQWLERFVGGDGQVQAQFVQLFREPVYRICLRRLQDEHLAADATQDTFCAVWRASTAFVPRDPQMPWACFRAWVFRIAHNTAINLFHARVAIMTHEQSLPDEWPELPGANSSSTLHNTVDEVLVQQALRRLSKEDREIITMAHVAGLRYHEIATLLGCTATAVGPRLHRALRRLREELGLPSNPRQE